MGNCADNPDLRVVRPDPPRSGPRAERRLVRFMLLTLGGLTRCLSVLVIFGVRLAGFSGGQAEQSRVTKVPIVLRQRYTRRQCTWRAGPGTRGPGRNA